jgi:hypothetical protein
MDRPYEQTEMHSSTREMSEGDVYEEPQGEMEVALAQVWKDAFRVEKIGRNDNFFGLGGNSLLGMELTEMLAIRVGIQVPVVVLFQYPTVREMAEIIGAADRP